MIDGLDDVLASSGQPGLPELRAVLQEVVGGYGPTARVIGQQQIQLVSFRALGNLTAGLPT